jgi:hypothetical protein
MTNIKILSDITFSGKREIKFIIDGKEPLHRLTVPDTENNTQIKNRIKNIVLEMRERKIKKESTNSLKNTIIVV